MSKSFAAPPRIRRIAARRVFKSPSGKPVVLTFGVPQPVPGSDWGCALQITGLNTEWRRPRYVFGIDGLQSLHLAMKCAGAVIESAKMKLEWLGQTEYLDCPISSRRCRSRSKIASKHGRARGDQVLAPFRARSQGEDFEAPQADDSRCQRPDLRFIRFVVARRHPPEEEQTSREFEPSLVQVFRPLVRKPVTCITRGRR